MFAMLANSAGPVLTKAKVTWAKHPDATVKRYRVYYGLYTATTNVVKEVESTNTCVLSQLVVGQTYQVVVTAVNDNGVESLPSQRVVFRPRLSKL